jgi:hypothetical protein
MRMKAISPPIITSNRLAAYLVLSLLALLLTFSAGCGGPATTPGDGTATSGEVPELTDEVIHERINGARVRPIPEENGTGEAISWSFYEEEPKEITVVEKQVNGDHATVVLDIKTQSSPRSRNPRFLAGQIRTVWELQTGWVLRKWEIINTENISMKYKNLPKPPATPDPDR